MDFPGNNKITLTDDAMRRAVENAINAARKDGEDYVRVTSVRSSYSNGPFDVSITTDPAKAAEGDAP